MDHSQFQRPTQRQNPNTDFDAMEIPPTPVGLPPISFYDLARRMERLEALTAQQNQWLERIAVMLRKGRAEPPLQHIKVEDINMPFWHMVGLMVKATIASIPAGILASLLIGGVVVLCGGTTVVTLLIGLLAALRK